MALGRPEAPRPHDKLRFVVGSAIPTAARSVEFDPYHTLFHNPDVNTVIGRYWPVRLEAGEPRLFATEPGVQVLGRCHWQRPGAPVALLVHGLEGSSESNYVLRMARALLDAGFNVVRLNVRTCGGTEHLAPTLYHSGLTVDLRSVIEQLKDQSVFVIGFSMGGNQALKLAGEWGEAAPSHLRCVCSISAPIDLAACARRLGEPRNRVYELHFLQRLKARLRRKALLTPERFSTAALPRVRTIIDFDHHVTAPAFGFRDAWDYYEQSSARRYLDRVRVPTLLIQARDDPFVPFDCYRLPENSALQLLATDHGGHVGFLSRGPVRHWAAKQVMRFCKAHAGNHE